MTAQPTSNDRAIDARALFAAAAFVAGMALILVLQRVGAPTGLTRGLGAALALGGAALAGANARTSRLTAFLAASRSAPALYAALAFCGVAVGLLEVFAPGHASGPILPLDGMLVGLALAGLAVGPMLRASGAASTSDFLATRFPGLVPAAGLAGLAFSCGGLAALAGFEIALGALVEATGLARAAAAALIGAVLVGALAPGGLAGLVASAAACGAGLILIAALGFASASGLDGAGDLVAQGVAAAPQWLAGTGGGPSWVALACAVGVAAQAALALPVLGVATPARARRSGALGAALVALLLFAALATLDAPPSGPAGKGFGLAAQALAGVSLAAAGAFAAARARGIDLAGGYRGFAGLASQKLARYRLATVAIVMGVGGVAARWPVDPAAAILLAIALSAAFVAPALALAFWPRARSEDLAVAFGVGALALAAAMANSGASLGSPQALASALFAGFGGLCAGVASSALGKAAQAGRARQWRDRFVDLPWDSPE